LTKHARLRRKSALKRASITAKRERAADLYTVAADKAGDIADAARDVAARKGTQVSAAIEAGKQAYTEEKRKTELTGPRRTPRPHITSAKEKVNHLQLNAGKYAQSGSRRFIIRG
jgi:uncharacterized protein YhbP (UPF0306 family)